MRSKNLFLLLLGFSSLFFTALPVWADHPIQADPESIDFGSVTQGEPVTVRYSLHNSGSRTITIRFMGFSEPGLLAQVSPRIEAGASADVMVRWKTASLSGDVQGKVTLEFDDPEQPEVFLILSGTVVPPQKEN
jgi:hypothetical protein